MAKDQGRSSSDCSRKPTFYLVPAPDFLSNCIPVTYPLCASVSSSFSEGSDKAFLLLASFDLRVDAGGTP